MSVNAASICRERGQQRTPSRLRLRARARERASERAAADLVASGAAKGGDHNHDMARQKDPHPSLRALDVICSLIGSGLPFEEAWKRATRGFDDRELRQARAFKGILRDGYEELSAFQAGIANLFN